MKQIVIQQLILLLSLSLSPTTRSQDSVKGDSDRPSGTQLSPPDSGGSEVADSDDQTKGKGSILLQQSDQLTIGSSGTRKFVMPLAMVNLFNRVAAKPPQTKTPRGDSRRRSAPDIRSVPPDLVVPPIVEQTPAPGCRVRETLPAWQDTSVYHTLYLPKDYRAGGSFPVIFEFPGNGGFQNRFGDRCDGLPDGCALGFGSTAGEKFIWVCLPFLDNDGKQIATTWWGDPPRYDPQPTIKYLHSTVDWICKRYGGDRQRLILAGFSRGAIACNYIGLHDATVARLWRGMIVYSHYDGVRNWPFSKADPESPVMRLQRLGDCRQWICHETTPGRGGLDATRRWLRASEVEANVTFQETGFRNHNDAWVLRPSPARRELRRWLIDLTSR